MDPSNITRLAPAGVPAALSAPQFPIGEVNFNLPFEVFDQFGSEPLGPGKVLAVLRGNSHPILVQFDDDGIENAILFDTDGSAENGDYTIKNAVAVTYPYTVYGILVRDDNKTFSFDSDVYSSEQKARDDAGSDAIVFPVVITAPIEGFRSAESAEDGSDVEEEHDDEEVEHDEGQANSNADLAPGEITSKYLDQVGRTILAGDETLRAYRNGFGWRNVKVVKIRNEYRKSFFVQAEDGSSPYWALNRNLSSRLS